MNKGVAILLCIIITSLTFKDLFTYANFYINNSSIIKNFCINRSSPELKCNGKCYLKKSLKENQEKEKEVPNPAKEKKSNLILLPIPKALHMSSSYKFSDKKGLSFYHESDYLFSYHKEIFHPPQVIS